MVAVGGRPGCRAKVVWEMSAQGYYMAVSPHVTVYSVSAGINSNGASVMPTKRKQMNTTIPTGLIASCGMNCRLCWGFVREMNTCPACLRIARESSQKSKYRSSCRIRNCEQLAMGRKKYCSESCPHFPCTRLRQLDKRYRTKYGMSMVDNLEMIDEVGIRHFIQKEKVKWVCPECGEVLCVHKPQCSSCGYEWKQTGRPRQCVR